MRRQYESKAIESVSLRPIPPHRRRGRRRCKGQGKTPGVRRVLSKTCRQVACCTETQHGKAKEGWLSVGTKSVLFGAHAFWWHPFLVLRAWFHLYRRRPSLAQIVAIFLHDLGYVGCRDMDGLQGFWHPARSAVLFARVAGIVPQRWLPRSLRMPWHEFQLRVTEEILGHSRRYCRGRTDLVSKLCWPDKLSLHYECGWFYLLRVGLTGELREYRRNSEGVSSGMPNRVWFRWLAAGEYMRAVKESERFNGE